VGSRSKKANGAVGCSRRGSPPEAGHVVRDEEGPDYASGEDLKTTIETSAELETTLETGFGWVVGFGWLVGFR
jgi:hypothetical protein